MHADLFSFSTLGSMDCLISENPWEQDKEEPQSSDPIDFSKLIKESTPDQAIQSLLSRLSEVTLSPDSLDDILTKAFEFCFARSVSVPIIFELLEYICSMITPFSSNVFFFDSLVKSLQMEDTALFNEYIELMLLFS
ncbi:hypothetical protein ADUPG1_010842, partial [Aduncisulcus paluster]